MDAVRRLVGGPRTVVWGVVAAHIALCWVACAAKEETTPADGTVAVDTGATDAGAGDARVDADQRDGESCGGDGCVADSAQGDALDAGGGDSGGSDQSDGLDDANDGSTSSGDGTVEPGDGGDAGDAALPDAVTPDDGTAADADAGEAPPPECSHDEDCAEGLYCTGGKCTPGGLPCTTDADCGLDPLGPECHDGVCGGCSYFPQIWDWMTDVELPPPPNPCPEGRYCPPGKSPACLSNCQKDSQCSGPGQDVCDPIGHCGCSPDPAVNSCDQFCMEGSWDLPPKLWSKCVGCQPFVGKWPAPYVPIIQTCQGDAACEYTGSCLGGICGFSMCEEDAHCAWVQIPGMGVAQVPPVVRCHPAAGCVASCQTVADCPALMRECIPGLACVPDAAAGFSVCRVP